MARLVGFNWVEGERCVIIADIGIVISGENSGSPVSLPHRDLHIGSRGTVKNDIDSDEEVLVDFDEIHGGAYYTHFSLLAPIGIGMTVPKHFQTPDEIEDFLAKQEEDPWQN